MNRAEKETLFTFFDIASRWLDEGITPSSPMPAFSDDTTENFPASVEVRAHAEGVLSSHGFASLDDVARAVTACRSCGLAAGRIQAVPGVGPERPTVLVIGEGPGADEDEQGEPFVGKAGQLLDKMLASIELSRDANCYIANIVKCRPPQNRDPLPDEASACLPFLEAQIALIKPAAILAVGRIASQNLLSTATGISRLRGQFFEYRGIPLMPTYHPSALLRDESLKRPAWEDLKTFRVRLLELAPDYADAFRSGKN